MRLKVRLIVRNRDQWCVRCGSARGLQLHHRRVKGMGGDTREHVDCPCNLLTLCAQCHHDIHNGSRAEAEAQGYLVSRWSELPQITGVMRHSGHGAGVAMWPTCSGEWITEGEA